MECGICMCPYDERRRRPKSLPCGHTFCLECLQDRDFNKRCPLDRRVISQTIAELPDNFQLLALLDDPISYTPAAFTAPRRLWCKTCSKEAPDSCLDAEHAVCSLRKGRSLQVQADLQSLQRGEVALQERERAMSQVQEDLNSWMTKLRGEVGELRAQLQQVHAAREQVEAALEGPSDAWEAAKQDAAQVAKLVPSFLKTSSLMQDSNLSCTVTATNGSQSTTATWQLDQLAQSDAPLSGQLRFLVYYLQKEKKLPEPQCTQEVVQQEGEGKVQRRVPGIEEINFLNTLDSEDKPALLQRVQLQGVRRLTSVWCDMDPVWTLQLLQAAAPLLEELDVIDVSAEHLLALHGMPRLRRLHLCTFMNDKPNIPAALPPLPEGHAGLQCLRVADMPRQTTISLLQLHSHSLQELWLFVGIGRHEDGWPWSHSSCSEWLFLGTGRHEDVWPWSCEDLDSLLQQCGLRVLQRLVLDRPEHSQSESECAAQLAAVRRVLPGVTVQCSQCGVVSDEDF